MQGTRCIIFKRDVWLDLGRAARLCRVQKQRLLRLPTGLFVAGVILICVSLELGINDELRAHYSELFVRSTLRRSHLSRTPRYIDLEDPKARNIPGGCMANR